MFTAPRSIAHARSWRGWGLSPLTLMLAGSAALMAALLVGVGVTFAGGETDLIGAVVAVAPGANGLGSWSMIEEKSGQSFTVEATSATEFIGSAPVVGDRMRARGELVGSRLQASRIERLDNGDGGGGGGGGGHGESEDIEGVLIALPANPQGIGAWLLRVDSQQIVTVVVTTSTVTPAVLPAIGAWVKARVTQQPDGALLASLIRVHDYEQNELVVRLATGVVSQTVANAYGLLAKATLLGSGGIYLFMTDDDEAVSLSALLADPRVLWAEFNFINGIPDEKGYKTWRWGGVDPTGYIAQHAFDQVNLHAAHSVTLGAGVVVAVLDTGVDLSHPGLAGHLTAGYDVVADDAIPQDEGVGTGWGHGTHVAGIVARVAPAALIMPLRVLDTNGQGNTFTLAYAIDWAVSHGADVINLSLGAEADSLVLSETIASAIQQGVVVVAAAGNDNLNLVRYPAAYANVLGVSSVDDGNVKASFSNFGRTWVDIAAPGVGITSTTIMTDGSGYAGWSGTSMSTAFVSGAAALLRVMTPTASVAQIDRMLVIAADDLSGYNPPAVATELGGLLNVGRVLQPWAASPLPPDERIYLPMMLR